MSSFFGDIGNFVSQATKSIGNFIGVDSSGKWTNQGGVFHWADEGLGELTGRNQARASLHLARDQFGYAQQQAEQLIQQQRWNRQQADITASDSAGAAARTASALGGANYSNSTPQAMGPGFSQSQNKDFLGL